VEESSLYSFLWRDIKVKEEIKNEIDQEYRIDEYRKLVDESENQKIFQYASIYNDSLIYGSERFIVNYTDGKIDSTEYEYYSESDSMYRKESKTIYSYNNTATSNETSKEEIKSFVLNQNYPNPFNPSTTFQFGIPEAAVVTLDIYNMLGQKVNTLVNERRAAGFHTVTFDATNLSSGMYIYRIQAGDFVSTKKMMLIK
jgi:flagellar hook assembly protein FlgD